MNAPTLICGVCGLRLSACPGCNWTGCHSEPTRLFPAGRRDARHTPAALAGRPEPGRTASVYVPQLVPNTAGVEPWSAIVARFERDHARREQRHTQRAKRPRPVEDVPLPERVDAHG